VGAQTAEKPAESKFDPCDLNRDGFVTTIDVILFSYSFGEKISEAQSAEVRKQAIASDFNRDGQVDEMDLFQILSRWRPQNV